MSGLFDGFPAPEPGVLTLYVLGPGVGEAQVVSLPDGKWLVADSCVAGGFNLPAALLRHFGATEIDLLVLTHSHTDHLRGAAELISGFTVKRAWRWAHAGTLEQVLPVLCEKLPGNKRLAELREVVQALDDLAERVPNSVSDASLDTRPWPPAGGEYQVHPIAPTPADVQSYRKDVDRIFEATAGEVSLTKEVAAFLAGGPRLAMPGNHLSMALSIGWRGRRVLLCGDVVVSAKGRGWEGIVALLKDEGLDGLLKGATAVKVAHHASRGAWHEEAWALHAARKTVELALVTPFASGQRPPPHAQVLRSLAGRARRLGLTATLTAAGMPTRNGWRADVPRAPVPGKAPAVAVVLRESGPLEVYVGKGARYFRRG